MIEAALCDDEPEILNKLEKQIQRYAAERQLDIRVEKYQSSRALADRLKEGAVYQFYILDMLMPEIDGIALGKEIRSRDSSAAIIYLTSSADFAFQAFGVFAQRYLLKPIQQKDLEEALEAAIGSFMKKQETLNVNTPKGIRKILYQEIEYIENISRTLHIHTTDGQEIVSRFLRQSFENEIKELLDCRDFLQIHKSFVVNLRYIKIYGPYAVTMQSGEELPISKSRQVGVKRRYLGYVSEEPL